MTPGDRADVEEFSVRGWVDPPMSQIPGRWLLLGDVDEATPVYLGQVRLRPLTWGRIAESVEALEIDDCPFVRPPALESESARWCADGVVVSVRFDGRNALGRLRMPSLDGPRPRERTHGRDERRSSASRMRDLGRTS